MYSLGNAAPVINPGYYDVPIQNKYSNPQRNGPYKQMTNYQFNGQVANQLNNSSAASIDTNAFNALRNKADIEDNRATFY